MSDNSPYRNYAPFIRQRQREFIHVPKGTTPAAVRNVPLTRRAHEVLKRRMLTPSTSPFVFPGNGKSGHIVTVQHAHERAIRKAKIGDTFEFYCWRHTYGTRCAENGVDRFALARLMGHSNPRTAEKYYIHVTEGHVAHGFGVFNSRHETKVAEAQAATAGAD